MTTRAADPEAPESAPAPCRYPDGCPCAWAREARELALEHCAVRGWRLTTDSGSIYRVVVASDGSWWFGGSNVPNPCSVALPPDRLWRVEPPAQWPPVLGESALLDAAADLTWGDPARIPGGGKRTSPVATVEARVPCAACVSGCTRAHSLVDGVLPIAQPDRGGSERAPSDSARTEPLPLVWHCPGCGSGLDISASRSWVMRTCLTCGRWAVNWERATGLLRVVGPISRSELASDSAGSSAAPPLRGSADATDPRRDPIADPAAERGDDEHESESR